MTRRPPLPARSAPPGRGGAPGAEVSDTPGPSAPPPSGATVDAIVRRVRDAGLKLTPQRLAIVRELANDPTHPTAQELYERLQREQPTMSFATVYNTLDALAVAGLCSSLALAPGAARFDANMDPHDHLVCDACGLVRDVRRGGADAAPPPQLAPAAGDGFRVRAVEQIYRGLCTACAARAS